jgi:hypothetical protein
MTQALCIFFSCVWLTRHDVSVAISTSIVIYKNNTHSVWDARFSQAGHSPAHPRTVSGTYNPNTVHMGFVAD